MECMCAQTRPRFILSSERVWRNGVRTHVNFKGKNPLYRGFRGGSNPSRCITQDREPNTLPTELFWPDQLRYDNCQTISISCVTRKRTQWYTTSENGHFVYDILSVSYTTTCRQPLSGMACFITALLLST